MTAVDFGLSLEEQCAAIWESTEAQHAELERLRRTPPLVRLWSGADADLVHIVECEDEASWDDVDNDTGVGTLRIDFDMPQAQWLNDMHGRIERGEAMNVLVSVDYMGVRWSGLLEEVDVQTDDLGDSTLVATFLSDFEQLKTKLLWSTPSFGPAFQPVKVFGLAGPAPWVVLTALHINLWRENGRQFNLPDDPLAMSSWWESDAMSDWTVVVKPGSFWEWLAAGVPWAILTSRFKYWHEAAQGILADAELSLQWRRWFEGDPEPWPGAQLRHGALVVWVEDKSGVEAGTSNGGTIFDGLIRTIRSYTDDFLEHTDDDGPAMPTVDAYRTPGDRRTDPRVPYVYYPPDSPGVLSSSFKQRPARAVQLVTGGHSMPGINETISAVIQATGDIIGNLLLVGSVGGSIDTLLAPFYEDTILAWHAVPLLERAKASGDFRYFEHFIASSGKAYTLDTLSVLRAGAHETRTVFSGALEITDAAPYVIGAPGIGHFGKGDRVVTQIPGDITGRLHVERVSKTTLSWGVDRAVDIGITLGGEALQQDPWVRLMADIDKGKSDLKELGVMS
ncbi:Gp37-like protein [Rhodococcus spongiicola]|uniref:Gp28/Gp37-like domain-containing protein n=1 Tax=Rhodococcus spongiicola TaxID=2487352 RepID=A0A438B5K1_9NOCA|nr:hypothetical protein [Rhodococcus spongiicola]RVW06220.1 hypothetical protein EF834_01830 [Rhodococcus spongiicola]